MNWINVIRGQTFKSHKPKTTTYWLIFLWFLKDVIGFDNQYLDTPSKREERMIWNFSWMIDVWIRPPDDMQYKCHMNWRVMYKKKKYEFFHWKYSLLKISARNGHLLHRVIMTSATQFKSLCILSYRTISHKKEFPYHHHVPGLI